MFTAVLETLNLSAFTAVLGTVIMLTDVMVHLNTFHFTGRTTPACLMNPFVLGAGGVTMRRHLTLTTLLMFLHSPGPLCKSRACAAFRGAVPTVPDVGSGLQVSTGTLIIAQGAMQVHQTSSGCCRHLG